MYRRRVVVVVAVLACSLFGMACGDPTASTSSAFSSPLECNDEMACALCSTAEGEMCRTPTFRQGWCTAGDCVDCTTHQCKGVNGCSADPAFVVLEAGHDTCPPGCFPTCVP